MSVVGAGAILLIRRYTRIKEDAALGITLSVFLGAGAALDGPALIDQPDSTVWILPDWRADVDRFGNLLIRRIG